MILVVLPSQTSTQKYIYLKKLIGVTQKQFLLCPMVQPVFNIYLLSLGEKVYDIG
jgi:hypothetical protein